LAGVTRYLTEKSNGRVEAWLADPPGSVLQGASGAGGADESVKLTSVGLLPDLRAGREDMGASVGRVVKLVGPNGVFEGLGVTLGLVVVVLGVVKGDGWREG
jgi:hypothetical protein